MVLLVDRAASLEAACTGDHDGGERRKAQLGDKENKLEGDAARLPGTHQLKRMQRGPKRSCYTWRHGSARRRTTGRRQRATTELDSPPACHGDREARRKKLAAALWEEKERRSRASPRTSL